MKFNEVVGRIQEAVELVVHAVSCMFQTMSGQASTCPPCWKCTTIRWSLFAVIVGLAMWAFSWRAILFIIIGVLALLCCGKGPWEQARDWLKQKLSKVKK